MSHVFLDKYENLEATRKVYDEFFHEGSEPACATVFVDWIPGGSHVEVTCIATTDLDGRKVVRAAGAKSGPNDAACKASPAVWSGNTLYMSALTGLNGTAGAASASLDDQVHQMARNHVAVLESAGLALEDIVAGWVYLRDMQDYQGMNAIYKQYYSRGPGVRTCLMPSASSPKNEIRVQGSFIAARTMAP
jgi:enamine deaminase RidA (YjgF/YER057c/UK114 family)